jgi:hypothetical protein
MDRSQMTGEKASRVETDRWKGKEKRRKRERKRQTKKP